MGHQPARSAPAAGAASPPISTPPTGCTPGSKTASEPAKTPGSAGSRPTIAINKAWLAAALIAATLLSWLRLLALDGDLARAEPKTLRYQILHAAGKLTRGARRRRLKIPATWPWAHAIATAWNRITALPKHPDQHTTHPCDTEGATPGPVEPPATRPASRATVIPATLKSRTVQRLSRHPGPAIRPHESSGLM